jgi:DNA polymerase III subunit alpha
LEKTDYAAHDAMICIGTGRQTIDTNRMIYSPQVYFKSAAEMRRLFAEVPEACDTTLHIAEMCDISFDLDATSTEKYPQFGSPDGSPIEVYFRQLCWDGLTQRYGERAHTDQELRDRLTFELDILEKMKYISYFLIVWDFIKWAKDNGIPVGPGRGSAAGSLAAYCLEITDIDPIRFNLLFERFLNPERVSPPDIDVDFCQSRRGEVIEYVREKYGERCVSHIVTFGTLGAKSVVRDVGRVLGWSYGDSDRVAKMIPNELNITLSSAREKNADLARAIEEESRTAEMWTLAQSLEGLVRGTGVHAAGIVIGSTELDQYVPLTRGNEGEVVTQYEMSWLSELGMLKMDFLGLKTLTVIDDAVKLIHRHTPDFRLNDADLDDPKTYKLLSEGRNIAVFQVESGGMMGLCRKFGVETIEHIIALLALYRPGPMQFIDDFCDRKHGRTTVEYLHPLLEEVSRETYGILVYQEQVQQAANRLAGYSLGGADMLRRAMGKKDAKKMAEERVKFVKGCFETNQITETRAHEIFDLLEKFAQYGFNKSHSAAYGMVTFQTAYLKANYPVEFMAAVLSNEISNTDKIAIFVAECQAMGIRILPPEVNRSEMKFLPETINGRRCIRYGLAAVKNVGEGPVSLLLAEREKNGPFANLGDFCNRLDSQAANKRVLESLVRAGAFDFIGEERAHLFAHIDATVASAASLHRDRAAGQGSLFDFDTLVSSSALPTPPPDEAAAFAIEPWPMEKRLADEKELLGFYVSGHPLEKWRPIFDSGKFAPLATLEELELSQRNKEGRWEGPRHHFAVMISEVEVKYSKAGKPFAILRIEDFTGQTEIMLWSETYERNQALVQKGQVVQITARVENDDRNNSIRLSPYDLKELPPPKEPKKAAAATKAAATQLDLHLSAEARPEEFLTLQRLLKTSPGKIPVTLYLHHRSHRLTLQTEEPISISLTKKLSHELDPWLSEF